MVGTGDAKRRMLARVKSDATYLTWMTFGHARTTSAPMPAADIYHFGPASERAAEWSRRTGKRRRPSLCRGRVWSLLRLVAVVSGLWSLSRLVAVASRRGRVLPRSRLVGSDKSDRPTDRRSGGERTASSAAQRLVHSTRTEVRKQAHDFRRSCSPRTNRN